MAEKKGGYQRPKESASYSGVGKNSRRTDGGSQAVRSPNVQDSTELTQGDRQRIEQGQRVAPLSSAPAPQVQAPAPGASPTSGAGGGAALLPPHLFGGDSTRPDEPITEGLPFGPGSGPEALTAPEPTDDMEVVLQGIVQLTGDQGIAQMLSDHREFKAWKTDRDTAPTAAPRLQAAPELQAEPEPIVEEDIGLEDDLALPDEDLATEEEVAVEGDEEADLSVETPEAAASIPAGGESAEPELLPPPA